MEKETRAIFSSAILLLAVYLWYDTLKLLVKNRMDENNEFGWIIISILVTIVVIYTVMKLAPGDMILEGPPPTDSKNLKISN